MAPHFLSVFSSFFSKTNSNPDPGFTLVQWVCAGARKAARLQYLKDRHAPRWPCGSSSSATRAPHSPLLFASYMHVSAQDRRISPPPKVEMARTRQGKAKKYLNATKGVLSAFLTQEFWRPGLASHLDHSTTRVFAFLCAVIFIRKQGHSLGCGIYRKISSSISDLLPKKDFFWRFSTSPHPIRRWSSIDGL